MTVLPGMELMGCPQLAVPADVMHHVVRVESSFNPYAIGVVGGRLARQPANLAEALATARMLESRGFNFSLGLAQVNRYNLSRYGLGTYEQAFQQCPNLQAGARILAECHSRSRGDWGKAFSCYYSGNFTTGFREGYVQKIYASMQAQPASASAFPGAIPVHGTPTRRAMPRRAADARTTRVRARIESIAANSSPASTVSASRANARAQSDSTPPDVDEVVVLRRRGAPRVAPVSAPDPGPASPVGPRDAAFVF